MIINYKIVDTFDIGSKVEYIGTLYPKGVYTITKIKVDRSKIYYSIIADNSDKEINFILSTVLRKIESEVIDND